MSGIKNKGIKYAFEGREYTLTLTLSVLDAICDAYGSTDALFSKIQSQDEREMRDAAIWTMCQMINDDIERQAEEGGERRAPYTPEYIKRHTRAIEIRPLFTTVVRALTDGLTDAADAAAGDDPNA